MNNTPSILQHMQNTVLKAEEELVADYSALPYEGRKEVYHYYQRAINHLMELESLLRRTRENISKVAEPDKAEPYEDD